MIADPSLFSSPLGRQALKLETEAFVGRAIAMIRRARAVVVKDRVEAAGLLASRRVALCQHLQRYQQFKHGCIFDPVVRYGTASSQVVARTLKAECVQMGEVFGNYHARWARMEAAEWPLYRRDMIETVDILVGHLDKEHRAIGQLLTIAEFYGGSPRRDTAVAA